MQALVIPGSLACKNLAALSGCVQISSSDVVQRITLTKEQAHPCRTAVRVLPLKISAMPNLYDTLIAILREHWKTHNYAYPQRIELSASDLQVLSDERTLVNETMNFKLTDGWEASFHGTPVQLGDVSCVIDLHGAFIPVVAVHTYEQA